MLICIAEADPARGMADALAETIARTRAAVSLSRQSIGRSHDRVRETLHILGKSRDKSVVFESGFGLPKGAHTDEQLQQAVDWWEAEAEQRQIEDEVRKTIRSTTHDS